MTTTVVPIPTTHTPKYRAMFEELMALEPGKALKITPNGASLASARSRLKAWAKRDGVTIHTRTIKHELYVWVEARPK